MIFLNSFFLHVITFAVNIPYVVFVFIYDLPTEDMRKMMTLSTSSLMGGVLE